MSDDPRRAYADACLAHLGAELACLAETIVDEQARVDRLSRDLVTASRSLHTARFRRRALEESMSRARAGLETAFDRLLALSGVQRVEVDGHVIRVDTAPVVVQHADRSYLVGRFELDLDLEGEVTIRNVENTITRGGWEHPHVQGGIPCLGNLRDGIMKLLGECELVPLTSMLLQFLEAYDADTAYAEITRWEEVSR
jgi:hypothetical protein